jgi:hypothetical protein
MDRDEHDHGPFPWRTAIFALMATTLTVLALIALVVAGAAENKSNSFGQGAWCIAAAVIPAWLSYFWFDEDHHVSGAVAFTLSLALIGFGVILMF